MTNQTYESVVILNAALEDDQIENTLKRIEEIIKTNGGELIDVEKWGRKRLAYPIKKSKSGYYAVYRFQAPSKSIYNLERTYRLDESIIRYLTVTLDSDALEHIEQMKQKKAREEEIAKAEAEQQAAEENKESEATNN